MSGGNEDDVSREQLGAILDSLRCPICLEILDQPTRVRDCGHIFCKDCVVCKSTNFRNAQCALCRNTIVSRRDLRLDIRLAEIGNPLVINHQIVKLIVPSVKDFRHYMGAFIADQSGRDLY